jgi:parallel beta-helix repeat protein
VQAEVPPWLDEITMRMVRETPGFNAADVDDPGRRYVDMRGVIEALESGLAPPEEIVLRPDGQGEYATLVEAVKALTPGGLIRLEPGEYELAKPLIIDKSLRLEGAGLETTVITGSNLGKHLPQSLVCFDNPGLFAARAITFRYTGDHNVSVLKVSEGKVDIRYCHITGGQVRGTTVIGSPIGSGLVMDGNNQGLVQNCSFENNSTAGIFITGGSAQISLTANHIFENGIWGIMYFSGSKGTIRDNQIHHNDIGITVYDRQQPTIENNHLSGNLIGIHYSRESGGIAKNNVCEDNRWGGISVGNEANPQLEANTCRQNHQAGIYYADNAGGVARKNICLDNQGPGIKVTGDARPTLLDNECKRNGDQGIRGLWKKLSGD